MPDLRVFGKTPKGAAELAARSGGLSMAQRRLLILVDGARDVEQLSAMVPSALEESLNLLEQGGFIAQVGGAVEAAGPAGAPEAVAETALGVATTTPDAELTTVPEAKARAVRAINDLLGPSADRLAIAIEEAEDGEQLRPLIREAERLVTLAHGAAAAQAFLNRVRRR
ncbi:MAG: hypothetical protein MUF32_04465 [Burkholderiaceae bacterium]|jgi:hypothetical protein|nr:hypothetical protein [Burkholderiaceae bacterium]